MPQPDNAPSLLETSQHELSEWMLGGERDVDDQLAYGLARVCLPHTIAAMKEFSGADGANNFNELIMFLEKHGVFNENDKSSEYFELGKGWLLVPLADQLRAEGSRVVVQNLLFGPDSDMNPAIQSGRVRSDEEIALLTQRRESGGENHSAWIRAIDETLAEGGFAIPVIQIPLMAGTGSGGHSVLVISHENGVVRYFDADYNATLRYEKNGLPVPGITRVQGEKRLYYEQPEVAFCDRMKGELLHVIPASASVHAA